MITLPGKEEMESLINIEISKLSSEEEKFFQQVRTPLKTKELIWEYGNDEQYDAWIFADFGERNVIGLYCEGGFGDMGSPWGLAFTHSSAFGMDCGWYKNLRDLLQDGWTENDP